MVWNPHAIAFLHSSHRCTNTCHTVLSIRVMSSPASRIYNPPAPKAGPGSAFAGTSLAKKTRRRRDRKIVQGVRAVTGSVAATTALTPNETMPGNSTTPAGTAKTNAMDWMEEGSGSPGHAKIAVPKTKKLTKAGFDSSSQHEVSACSDAEFRALPSSKEFRHVVGIDTRFLDTPETRSVGQGYVRECDSFFASLVRRGITPDWVAWTIPDNADAGGKSCSYRLRIRRGQKVGRNAEENGELFAGVLLDGRVDEMRKDSDTPAALSYFVSDELRALQTWKVFSDMGKFSTWEIIVKYVQMRTPLIRLLTVDSFVPHFCSETYPSPRCQDRKSTKCFCPDGGTNRS